MREIVLDTETTGFNHAGDDRIVEIGCVELLNHIATGRTYHSYVNPERDIPDGAFGVHGLSREFLSDHPVFADIVDEFLEFLGDAGLVIHNAEFDMGFINSELKRLDRPPLEMNRAIDTVRMARRKFPGSPASLDALCRRFQIDLSGRETHGALKDALLLAEVYLELAGGRQPGLELSGLVEKDSAGNDGSQKAVLRPPRQHALSPDEIADHEQFLKSIKSPVWDA